MATVSVRIDLNHRQINRILRSPNGMTARNMLRRAHRVQRHARRNVNSRTGQLARSIEVRRAYFAGAPGAEVYTGLYYAIMVHDGTGIYGPTGRPIRAQRGRYLVFEVGGRTIFARQVRGQRANPFLRDALRSAV